VELEQPLELLLDVLASFSGHYDAADSNPVSFDETDLRLANRGGARIASTEIAAILERRGRIEEALGEIPLDASLTGAPRSVPWSALTELIDAFGGIRGVGLSKTTKTLHKKRPALIPILDSVVQAYLTASDPDRGPSESFGALAVGLVRQYKRDLDRNRRSLRELRRQLAKHSHVLTEVRILDLLIWTASTTHPEERPR
jgi:uncharacterized protein DUF6308